MLSRPVKKGQHRVTFRRSRLEEGFDVSLRNNEAVPWRDWVGVVNPHRMFVLTQNSSCGERAEGARGVARHVFESPGSPIMDLVPVQRLEDPERTSLLAALFVNLDAQQGGSLAKGRVDAVVGLALVSHSSFERPKQADDPAVLAPAQIEAPSTWFTHEDVDIVGRDTVLLERPDRSLDVVLAVEQASHPVDQREQVPARVGVGIDAGHGSPFARAYLGVRIRAPYIPIRPKPRYSRREGGGQGGPRGGGWACQPKERRPGCSCSGAPAAGQLQAPASVAPGRPSPACRPSSSRAAT